MSNKKVGCGAVYTLGEAIEYGNLGTAGTLSSGDAFDCDVNKDGTYDPATERFYYVSDYYNTASQEFENDKATLIYYNNTIGGISNNTDVGLVPYNSEGNNYEGPISALANLPTRTQWKNKNLITGTRAIIGEGGETFVSDKIFPTAFDYSNYAARLLTVKEMMSGCNISTVGSYTIGELDNCIYLLENTDYTVYGKVPSSFWLETPYALTQSFIWSIDGSYRQISDYDAQYYGWIGVRPVITLLKSNISY